MMDHFEKAIKLYKQSEKLRKEAFKEAQQARRDILKRYEISSTKSVEIFVAPDSCDICKILVNKPMLVKEALKIMPIPVKNCEHGWCRCTYLPIIE